MVANLTDDLPQEERRLADTVMASPGKRLHFPRRSQSSRAVKRQAPSLAPPLGSRRVSITRRLVRFASLAKTAHAGFQTRGTQMTSAKTKDFLKRLGIELPIFQAPMAGTSTPAMAAAV